MAPPSNPPLEHRLRTNMPPFATTLEAKDALLDFAREAGFAFKVKSNKRVVDGVPGRIDIQCDRAGQVKHTNKSRSASSIKCGCEWSAVIVVMKSGDFRFDTNGEHNHDRSDRAVLHRSHRELQPEHNEFVDSLLSNSGIMPAAVLSAFRTKYPDQPINIEQIYNHRRIMNMKELGGLTPTQALIHELQEGKKEGILQSKVYWSDEGEDKPVSVVWSYEWSLEQSKRFWDLLMMDNTYKTNMLGMPLFQAIGLTNLNTIFIALEGLVNTERLEGFTMMCAGLAELREEEGIPPPKVVITDFDRNMRAAVMAAWPSVQLQICIFHVNKNMILNVTKKFKKPAGENVKAGDEDEEFDDEPLVTSSKNEEEDEEEVPKSRRLNKEDFGDLQKLNAYVRETLSIADGIPDEIPYSKAGVYLLWRHMIYAPNEPHFWLAWRTMEAHFDRQKGILKYIEKQWMPVKTQWSHAWTQKYQNYGHRTTSPAENANRMVKGELRSGRSTVKQVANAVKKMVDTNKENFLNQQSEQKFRLLEKYNGQEWLGDCPFQVSRHACALLTKQHEIMLGALPNARHPKGVPLKDCQRAFQRQNNMKVCAHVMLERKKAGKKALVTKEDLPDRWLLTQPLDVQMPILQVKNMEKVTIQKGRPKDQGPFKESSSLASSTDHRYGAASSIRRKRSHWETITDAEEVEVTGVSREKTRVERLKAAETALEALLEVHQERELEKARKEAEEAQIAALTTVSSSGRIRKPSEKVIDGSR